MTLVQIQVNISLTEINCGECGGTYAINERYRQQQYEKGGSWNCPYCRVGWGYSSNSENSKLKKQLEQKQKWIDQANAKIEQAKAATRAAELQVRGQKAAKTRLKNRISKGVCPCCNRSFDNLHRHMKTKHPDFTEQEA